jgi:hypothetical protein
MPEFLPVPRTLVGTPDQVRNVLNNAHRAGRLVDVAPARRVGPNRVSVDLVLMEPAAIRPAERVSKPRSVPARYKVAAGAVTAALVALAAIGALIAALVQWVMDHFAVIAGCAVVLALVALGLASLASKTGRCMGIHCEGCGHR